MAGYVLVDPDDLPTDTRFVRLLSEPQQDRIRALGFSECPVIFFEIPFCAISGVFAGLLRDYAGKCFYKFFCSTDGVIAGLSDEQIRVLIDHEANEIQECLAQALNPEGGPGFVTLESEVKRHVPEFELLRHRHGDAVVSRTLEDVVRISACFPTIPRYVAAFWLLAFVVSASEEFAAYALPMPDAMVGMQQRAVFRETLHRISKEYYNRMPMDVLLPFLVAVELA